MADVKLAALDDLLGDERAATAPSWLTTPPRAQRPAPPPRAPRGLEPSRPMHLGFYHNVDEAHHALESERANLSPGTILRLESMEDSNGYHGWTVVAYPAPR